jgi:hypothetical protein
LWSTNVILAMIARTAGRNSRGVRLSYIGSVRSALEHDPEKWEPVFPNKRLRLF